jgi:hypothetical protein
VNDLVDDGLSLRAVRSQIDDNWFFGFEDGDLRGDDLLVELGDGFGLDVDEELLLDYSLGGLSDDCVFLESGAADDLHCLDLLFGDLGVLSDVLGHD